MSAWTIRIEAETDASAERALRQALKSLPLAEDGSAPYRLEINSEDVSDGAFDKAASDGWVEHDGGPCPVRPVARVDVKFAIYDTAGNAIPGSYSYGRVARYVAWSKVLEYRLRPAGGE